MGIIYHFYHLVRYLFVQIPKIHKLYRKLGYDKFKERTAKAIGDWLELDYWRRKQAKYVLNLIKRREGGR